MRALVTGGAGFVGSHIVDALVDGGDEVLVVDDLSTGKAGNVPPQARLEELDVRNPTFLKLTSSFRPDLISHCSARASVPFSVRRPEEDASVNVMGGLNVLRAAVECEAGQIVYVTTGGALYGEPEYLPFDEGHPIRPISPYGLSKWTLEQYLHLLLPSSIRLKVLRLANVYGPRQDPEGEAGVVSIFGRAMLRNGPVTIFGDGEQTRDLVYATDVARAHQLAAASAQSVTANIGSETRTSVNKLFGLLAAETRYRREPVHAPNRPGDVKHVVLDASRARDVLGWTPETDLVDGLRETVEWLSEQA